MHNNQRKEIQALIDAGEKEDATRALVACVLKYPDDIIAWEMLALLVESPAKKRDCYQKILELDPAHRLANSFFARQRFAQDRSATKNAPTQSRIGRIQGLNANASSLSIAKIIGHIDKSTPNNAVSSTGDALPPKERRECPKCQASIPKIAYRCQWCGESLSAAK